MDRGSWKAIVHGVGQVTLSHDNIYQSNHRPICENWITSYLDSKPNCVAISPS